MVRLDTLEKAGYRIRVIPSHHAADAREIFISYQLKGWFDQEYYKETAAYFNFAPPAELPDVRSIILMTYADPPTRFTFHQNGRAIPAIVPPTYLHGREKDQVCAEALQRVLDPEGYKIMIAPLPLKTIATSNGLARYGKNNITYIDGFGSFYRMVAFYSDMPCLDDPWNVPCMLPTCQTCKGCLRNCPSGAISDDRFLLYAERCLTYHNEKPSDIPFPTWFKTEWHNYLVGCMDCQMKCPENRHAASFVDGMAFSEEETRMILDGLPSEQMPAALREKLKQCDLLRFFDLLPRNLTALLSRLTTS